ncbi:transaldolase [Micrococcus sp. FDAARGOS_333]|uniref:transaldolase n=1 Tax=Micrococcus sp. FDAARGOS_333 TaxID=1930558 RepID=UPI000B4E0723|nr:transaldolase [Micrococcus sp. FDAARGOS_333]PNL17986.1 transaldolase [Micrococcus sp. FDAARGOS_333]
MVEQAAQNPNTAALAAAGVSVWLDDLSRARLVDGSLADLVATRSVTGVTTNPAIFQKALEDADVYAAQLDELAAAGADVDAAVTALTTRDVAGAAEVLAPVHAATEGADGFVSIEVDPRLARDTSGTIRQARELAERIGRQNVMIKIPATVEGLPAVTAVLAEGISVNVTLIFSLPRYREVVNAWMSGLEQARSRGRDLSRIHSVASFFVSRVDTEVDRRLEQIGGDAVRLKGRAGVANARLAYRIFDESLQTERWRLLEAAGAPVQRPLWASTGVKDPALPDTLYVTELVAERCVNTMPAATLEAVADHGEIVPAVIPGGYADADAHLDAIGHAGVSYREVVDVLEAEGLEKFETAWEQLLDSVSEGLASRRTR